MKFEIFMKFSVGIRASLRVAMGRFSTDYNAIRILCRPTVGTVLTVGLRMTKCFHVIRHIQITSHNSYVVRQWRAGGEHCLIICMALSSDSDFPAVLL